MAGTQFEALSMDGRRTAGGPHIGCLPYLNVKPLVYPLEHGALPEAWELVYATPSELAGMLEQGTIDVAPVSSFAWLANRDFGYVPGICISSDGPVQTVLMLSKVPVREVRSVAADISSLSGRALLRIVLSESYDIEPEFVDCGPEPRQMLEEHDAALIIGNPAMLCDKTGLEVLDLGEEWKKLTGLPAVFALWAGPQESITREVVRELTAAKETGLARLETIATEQSETLAVPYQVCEDYLKKIMRYDLGPREVESLELFGKKAVAHGLIPQEAAR